MQKCNLPSSVKTFSWLDMSNDDGKLYWKMMELAGDYAKACHDNVHMLTAKSLKLKPLTIIENNHNYAWKETHHNKQLIVHRKGSTPAHKGHLGIIPGTMTDETYIVKGLGNIESLCSSSHGAGRSMSRKEAREKFTYSTMKKILKEKQVDLISGGIDEIPLAYKNIKEVMHYQKELVETIGIFKPRIVKMDYDK